MRANTSAAHRLRGGTMQADAVSAEIARALLRSVNDPGSVTHRRSDKGQMETLGTWQVRAIQGLAVPLIVAQAQHDALCWRQHADGGLVPCDRARMHKGPHSWELA
jgi:hypothetical protein